MHGDVTQRITMQVYLREHNIKRDGTPGDFLYFGYSKNSADERSRKYKQHQGVWGDHIREYGDNYTTTILFESDDQEKISAWCVGYSLLNNIWNNSLYANMMMENGRPGGIKQKFRGSEFIDNCNNGRTQESITKGLATKTRNGNTLANPEVQARRQATMIKNGTSCVQTPDIKAKVKATKIRNGTTNNSTPEVRAKQSAIKKGTCFFRDLRTGETGRTSTDEFHKHNYLVGNRSKVPNY